MTWFEVAVLAVGTFLIRLSGPWLRGRIDLSEETEELLKRAAIVVLVALVVTSTVVVEGGWGGWALLTGVATGGLLAWLKAPFAVVVLGAAATTALLRLAGVA